MSRRSNLTWSMWLILFHVATKMHEFDSLEFDTLVQAYKVEWELKSGFNSSISAIQVVTNNLWTLVESLYESKVFIYS